MQERDFRLVHGSWVLVADGEKALFLKNHGDATHPQLEVLRELEQDNPPSHDQGTHKPGRADDGGPGQRSAVADTDWHKLEKERFAKDAGKLLYKYAHKHRFEHIVLIAAPSVLGDLRKELHKEVEAKILGEVAKDLTNHPVHKIEDQLKVQ